MEISASPTFSPAVPQNFEADPDAAGQQGAQEQDSAADSSADTSASVLNQWLLGSDASSIVAQIQKQTTAQAAAPEQTTGTIGPAQGYLADLEGIAKSGLSVGDKLKMAWDTTKDHWNNSGMANGTVQIPGGGVQVDENGGLSTQQGGPKICVGPAAIEEGIATSLAPAAERIAGRMLAPEAAQVSETLASKTGATAGVNSIGLGAADAGKAATQGTGETVAGGALEIGPWGKGVTNVADGTPFTQCGNGSCVSATAQVLTNGAATEQQVLARIGEWADPTRLPSVLDELAPSPTPWKGGYFASGEEALAVASRGEMGAVLQAPGRGAHMVTISPIEGSPGMFRVQDTGVGKTYDVTSSWIQQFVSGGVWK